MADLTVRIKNSDFSNFAGYYYTDESHKKHNEELNEYINLFKTNDNIRYFQVECDNDVRMHTIAFICENVNEKHFIKTEFAERSRDNKYLLCFYKEDKKKEGAEE